MRTRVLTLPQMAGKQFRVNDPQRVTALGKVLANPRRVGILIALANEGPGSATTLTKAGHLERVSLSNVSYHLVKLFDAGLAEQVKALEGRGSTERHYGLTGPGRALARIITEIGE